MPPGTNQQVDFDKLTEQGTSPKTINTQFGPGLVSILPDGTKVVSRPSSSSTGEPTIEIQKPNGKTVIEIRYPKK